jgi:hypothetical protein
LARDAHDHHEPCSIDGYVANIAYLDPASAIPPAVAITIHRAPLFDDVATLPTLTRRVELYREHGGRFVVLDSASDSAARGAFLRTLGLRPVVAFRAKAWTRPAHTTTAPKRKTLLAGAGVSLRLPLLLSQ